MGRGGSRGMMATSILLGCALTGCAGVQDARETAKFLGQSIGEYDQSLDAVREAEKRFQNDIATAIHGARLGLLSSGLTNQRLLQASRYSDYLAERPNDRVTQSGFVEFMLKAVGEERDLYVKLRNQAESARDDTLKRLENFQKRSREIDEVQRELEELTRESTPLGTAKFLADFLEDVRKQVEAEQKKSGGR